MLFFIIDKVSSQAGFSPRAVVWRPLEYSIKKKYETI